MSTDEIYRSIRKIAKWNPDNVSISGGEPLVRRDIKEILIYLRKVYNGKITLSTNGLLIDKENIETLKKCVDYFEIVVGIIDTGLDTKCKYFLQFKLHLLVISIEISLGRSIFLSSKIAMLTIFLWAPPTSHTTSQEISHACLYPQLHTCGYMMI